MELYEILRRPLITEKGTTMQSEGKYVFEVGKKANKRQIKEAVEKAFNVKVAAVNVMKVPGQTKRMGKREITTSPRKKAVVTLRPGDKIQLFEGV